MSSVLVEEFKILLVKMLQQPRHRSQSILSNRTNSTWREDVFGQPRLARGAMVFTGKYVFEAMYFILAFFCVVMFIYFKIAYRINDLGFVT